MVDLLYKNVYMSNTFSLFMWASYELLQKSHFNTISLCLLHNYVDVETVQEQLHQQGPKGKSTQCNITISPQGLSIHSSLLTKNSSLQWPVLCILLLLRSSPTKTHCSHVFKMQQDCSRAVKPTLVSLIFKNTLQIFASVWCKTSCRRGSSRAVALSTACFSRACQC